LKINFESIKLQNFLSYQKEQEFKFEGKLTLISAKNGSGKSAISDGLYYALFGKNARSKKINDLININSGKNLKVELNFSINDDKYKIIRGIKPNIFEIYKNNKLIDMNSSIKEYQKQLDKILQFDELIFNQLLYLGANVTNSKNFMELNSKEKEEVFQILMDTSFFNELNNKGKDYKKYLNEEISNFEFMLKNSKSDLEFLKQSLEEDKKHNEIVQNQKDNLIKKYNQDILDIEKEIKLLENNKIQLEEELNDIEEKFNLIEENYKKELNDLKIKIKDSIDNIKNKIKIKENDLNILQEKLQNKKINIKNYQQAEKEKIICDKCGNEIKQHFDFDYEEEKKIAKELKKNIDELFLEIKQLNEEIIKIKSEALNQKNELQKKYDIDNISNNINNLKNEIIKCNNNIDKFKKNIKAKQFDIKQLENMQLKEINYDHIKIKEKNIKDLEEKIIKLKEKITLVDEFLELISDNNLKGQFIEKHLPLLNYHINNYIVKFGLPYNFILDKKFKEIILYNDSELNFGQLSNGQKMRIIIAILFAFLKLSEEKAKVSFNILILDEFINGSLDNDGIEDILKILSTNFEEKNIILITHNDDIKNSEIFDKIVKIEKTDKGSIIY